MIAGKSGGTDRKVKKEKKRGTMSHRKKKGASRPKTKGNSLLSSKKKREGDEKSQMGKEEPALKKRWKGKKNVGLIGERG